VTNEPGALAQKLDRLFQSIHTRGRAEISYREVARAIEEMGGPTVSASYLHALRTGSRDNPTMKHLEALAAFFGVPPAYFFDDAAAARVDAQLELLAEMRDAGIRRIAQRAQGLSPVSLDMIREIVERTRRIEGLDD
jgi:transcriptional regulator with XRE-family HTH domain